MAYTATDKIRSGKGGKAYQRERSNLMKWTQANDVSCFECGKAFDWTITDSNNRGYFTADHPINIAHGGKINGQELEPMHRGCNSRKGNRVVVTRNIETYL